MQRPDGLYTDREAGRMDVDELTWEQIDAHVDF